MSAPQGVPVVTVNGRRLPIDPTRPQQSVLDLLREHGLTGAKEGCAEGECGACAVVVVVPNGSGAAYRAVNSCLMFAADAVDRECYTVEALAVDGVLSAPQRALAEAGGSQCGYCTPGFVMSLFAEYQRPGRSGPCDPHALAGNLCRCTGYRPIRDAALALGAAEPSALRDRTTQPARPLGAFAVPSFHRPDSLEALLAALQLPGAHLLAGGTDLGVESNLRDRRWPLLVSTASVTALHEFSESEDKVVLGAGLSLTDLAERWTTAPEAVREWFTLFASPLVRNRATLGGNLATASPIGDAAPILMALDASIELVSSTGRRTVPVSAFFTGYRKTVRQNTEVITRIEIPRPYPQHLRFYKVSKRRLDDISTVAAAMAVDLDARQRVSRALFAFGGVAATPIRIGAAEAAVLGEPWTERTARAAGHLVQELVSPLSDHRGSREYRREVSGSLLAKFWWQTQGHER